MKEKKLSFDDILKGKLHKIISENKSAFEDFSEVNAEDYLEDIKKVKKAIDKRKSELNAEFSSDFYYEKCQLELVILQQLQMFIILDKDFGLKSNKNTNKEMKQPLFVVTNLMHQMHNNLVAFYKLLSDGFSFQANLIFRSLIEQGSTIFAILFDDNFLEEFKKNGNIQEPDEKLKHWRKNLSPRKINIILQKGYSEIESLHVFKDLYFEFKRTLYQDSSEFVHSQFLPSLLSSYSSKKSDDEYLDLNLLGRMDSNVERVCIKAIPYFNLFFDNFVKILSSKFHYGFGNSNKNKGIKMWLAHNLADELGKEYVAQKNYS